MGRFRAFNGRHRLEMAVVLVPLLAILVLQYVSSRRLAEVEVIAHQTTVARYLEAVAADVRRVYENAAHEMLDVSGDWLAAKRFDRIAQHFDRVDTAEARLLFAGALDGCLCLTRYYDPAARTMDIGAAADVEAVIYRASTLLRAGTLFSVEERLPLDRSTFYVDEADPGNRAVFRFVADRNSTITGFVGFIVDGERFERQYLPQAIDVPMDMLSDDVQANVIVRVTDANGRVSVETGDDSGQADVLAARFDFVFRDWSLSVRSREMAAAQVLRSNAAMNWVLTVLMSTAVLGGVLLTWRAAGRERRLSRIRNEFVANVSHELRTPVASLAVVGEFLRCGRVRSPEKVADYGRRIEDESDRLRHLIDNVLDFARIESVEMQYRREEVAPEDVVTAAIGAVDTRRQREDFTISVDWPHTLLPVVRVDAQAMRRVLVNLLDNAMKYSGRSRRICVQLALREDCVAVSVADSGIGIASEDHERIFQQFYRAATAEGMRGTGLGLAIVRHVMHAHGGRVEVDSRVGIGAKFTVLIPVSDRAADREVSGVSAAVENVGFKAGAEA